MQTDNIGSLNNGGLPNIVGSFGNGGRNASANGVFYLGDVYPSQNRDAAGSQGARWIGFNVGWYNSAYHRNDNQVIPKHLGVNMCIKY